MSSIHLNTPPSPKTYSISMSAQNSTIEYLELEHFKSNIGSRINADYEENLTPMQKKRLATISGSAIAAIATVALIITAVTCSMPPLLFVAVPLGILSIGLLVYTLTRGKDMDSPKAREKMMQEIARSSFASIAYNYETDKIIQYQLLDGITPNNSTDPQKRALFYKQFQHLGFEWNRLDSWRAQQQGEVKQKWSENTKAVRDWYSDQMELIDQRRLIIRQQEDLRRARKEIHDLVNKRPATPLHILDTAVSIGNIVSEYQLDQKAAEINQTYGAKMAPWNNWRSHELDLIQQAFQTAEKHVESEFQHIKSAVL